MWLQATFEAGLVLALNDGGAEQVALLEAKRRAGIPGLLGGEAVQSPGSGGGVGLESRCFEDVAGPLAWVSRALAVLLGPFFQGADAGFDGAIVRRSMGWREELKDVTAVQMPADTVGTEGRTVIGFQEPGCAVQGEEQGELVEQDVGGEGADGLPQQLEAAGEVADGEDVGIRAVDEARGMGEVGGPNGAGPLPVEDVEQARVVGAPLTAILLEEFVELGAGDAVEEAAQGRHTDAGADVLDAVEDGLALCGGGERAGPAEEWDGRGCGAGGTPGAQRACVDAEVLSGVGVVAAEVGQSVGDFDGALADVQLELPARLLVGGAAAWWRGCGTQVEVGPQDVHVHVRYLRLVDRERPCGLARI